jgi:hypothetical protein
MVLLVITLAMAMLDWLCIKEWPMLLATLYMNLFVAINALAA